MPTIENDRCILTYSHITHAVDVSLCRARAEYMFMTRLVGHISKKFYNDTTYLGTSFCTGDKTHVEVNEWGWIYFHTIEKRIVDQVFAAYEETVKPISGAADISNNLFYNIELWLSQFLTKTCLYNTTGVNEALKEWEAISRTAYTVFIEKISGSSRKANLAGIPGTYRVYDVIKLYNGIGPMGPATKYVYVGNKENQIEGYFLKAKTKKKPDAEIVAILKSAYKLADNGHAYFYVLD